MDEIEKKAQELSEKLEIATKAAEELKAANEALTKRLDTTEEEKKKMQTDIDNIDASVKAINEELKAAREELKKSKIETFGAAVEEVILSPEFKSEFDEVISRKRSGTRAFEVKTDPSSILTSGATNPVSRTMPNTTIYSAGYEPNKFLAAMNIVTIPPDKNRAMWFDGVYYANVGYAEELTAITTGDGATIEEKYREIGKIAAKLPFSSESVSDMSYFVNWAKNEGLKSVQNYVDTLIYSGDGADGGANTKKIYGLKTQGATAFNATTAGVVASLENANLADLILACQTQINVQSKNNYAGTIAFVHPATVTKLRSMKNLIADYLNVLPNGTLQIHGVTINESSKVAVDELLVCDQSTLSLYQKGALEMEMERVASTDSFVMYLRWRGQVVVPTFAKLGNVFVSSIATALAAINKEATLKVEVRTTSTTTTTTTTTTTGA